MKLDDLVAVSGLSGVYKMVANRSNGLIVENLDSGKRKFAPSRTHQFTPLASIGIYTDEDTTELRLVFKAMLEKMEELPVVVSNDNNEIRKYFREILPNYDEDRVFISDIKKVIKWFAFLNERNHLNLEDLEKPVESEEDTKEGEENKVESKKEAKT